MRRIGCAETDITIGHVAEAAARSSNGGSKPILIILENRVEPPTTDSEYVTSG